MRSVSSPEAIDKARRDLATRGGSRGGSSKIQPKDVLDRYSGDRSKSGIGSRTPGARPSAPGAGRGATGTRGGAVRITDVRDASTKGTGAGKRPGQSPRPGTKNGSGIGTRPGASGRPGKTADRPTKSRPGAGSPGGRPIAPGAGDGRKGGVGIGSRPGGATKGLTGAEAARARFNHRLKQATGGPGARPSGRPGVNTNGITAVNGATRPLAGRSGRGGVRPAGGITHVGSGITSRTRIGGAWVNTYNSPNWYYNNCYWNTWGGLWNSNWGTWCGAPFYYTGYWWNNYWAGGGTWWPSSNIGFGFRRPWRSRFANLYFFGPFLGASSFVVYEDEEEEPEPEVIYIEVPADDTAVAEGEGTVLAAPAPAVGGGQPRTSTVPAPAPGLASDATEPSLQRELNRASAYYLTQGDRAFREARFGDAVHFYAKSVEFAPDSGILYLVLSDALFATGDYRYAAYSLRQAFEKESALADNVVDKREFYAEPAKFEEQLETLERFVQDHVLDTDARLVLTANYLFGGRPAEALSLLESPFSEELAATDVGRLLKTTALRVLLERESGDGR